MARHRERNRKALQYPLTIDVACASLRVPYPVSPRRLFSFLISLTFLVALASYFWLILVVGFFEGKRKAERKAR